MRKNEQKILDAMQAIQDCPVRGHLRKIDDTRLVFLGQDPADNKVWFLCFRNSEGNDTRLVLSEEAYQALKWLMTEPFKGERVRFPYTFTLAYHVRVKQALWKRLWALIR